MLSHKFNSFSINYKNDLYDVSSKRLPLHKYVKENNRIMMETLLVQGVNYNDRDENDMSPLFLACKLGRIACAKRLIWYGAGNEKNTKEKPENVNFLNLSTSKMINNIQPFPLHIAIQNELYTLLQYFLKNGFFMNIEDNYGNNLLHLLAFKGKDFSLKSLLDGATLDYYNFNAEKVNVDGKTPIEYARKYKYSKTEKLIRSRSRYIK